MMSLNQKLVAVAVLVLLNLFTIVVGLAAGGLFGLVLAAMFLGLSVAAGAKVLRM